MADHLEECEILKVPHHGALNALRDDFAETLEPKLAVISVGKNSYGHPRDEILEKLEKAGVQVLRTDKEGTIKIKSDGLRFWKD